ncbi:MAG: hypothetical protein B7Y25_05635 [Alphaproteobacteria bacterium 16-39-46]|nr:MAG: hypothetical protein B7Y25_05635 [Alphaproteobacteria bacterium 16-39-46]OZA42579.1 MAG: hypothetical protein B7X84_05535 [Alphaproteobacteria bacterium 17-39-52]HQS84163.1 methyltransferase domain-containing protein [Alphaproteobacteria bacterium]HQS94024.1 methyltransferase domain-containing protein [Alphaproteobacteria bacterium]
MTSSSLPQIFCKSTLKQHRLKGLSLLNSKDPFLLEVENNLLARVKDFKKDFPEILTLGFRTEALNEFIKSVPFPAQLISGFPLTEGLFTDFVFDEERLPLAPKKFDLIISALHLHTVNDLPGSLIQLRHALKPHGLFMGAFLGGETLKELRTAFFKAETLLKNGISARFAPQIDIKGAANLLKRAGFETPISESQTITLFYETPLDLCHHLKALSETNSLVARSKGLTSPTFLTKAFEYYEIIQDCFPLTFEIIYVTAWKI